MKAFLHLPLLTLGLTTALTVWAQPVYAVPVDCNIFFNGSTTIQIAWNATPGKTYLLQTTTNLSQSWQNALPPPGTVVATSNQIWRSFQLSSAPRFFKLNRLDTDGPEVYQVSPLDGAIAVGQQADLQAWLRDETGLNPDSISLQIGAKAAVNLTDPRLTYLGGVLTYTPGTNEYLGSLGSNVTVRVSATDTLGNQTNFTWSFQLALPVIPSTNILFLNGSGGFVLVSTNGDNFTYSYTPPFPGLTNGQQLVDTNLYTGYTRTVVSYTNYPANSTVVVLTRPTKPAELFQQGSLSSANFTEIGAQAAFGGAFALKGARQLQARRDFGVTHTIDLQRVLYQNANLLLELSPGSSLTLTADLDFQANFDGLRLRQFAATLSGSADLTVNAHAQATGAIDRSGTTNIFTEEKLYRTLVATPIGVVPLWVKLVLELNAGYNVHMEAQADVTGGLSGAKSFLAGQRWDRTTGWTTLFESPSAEFSVLGPTWQVQVSGTMRVYLQPKLSLYLYSVAGVTADMQRYVELQGQLQLNPNQCPELALYHGLTSTIGLDLRGWDDSWGELPETTFDLIPRTLLGRVTGAFGPPQITEQPMPQTLSPGQTATFSVHTCGTEPITYRWQKNGLYISDDSRVSGSRTATLQIFNVQPNDTGDYRVLVGNSQRSTNSQSARLTVIANEMSWSALGSGIRGSVLALAVSGSNVYAGGSFTMAGGIPANNIARWNGSNWSALGSGVNGAGVRALAVIGSDLYAGGAFSMAGGLPANNIAKWNGSNWSALGSGVGSWVLALAASGNNLYAGGSFVQAGGIGVDYVAKWDGTGWSSLPPAGPGPYPGPSHHVYALAVSGNDVYAGGTFGYAGDVLVHKIAKWNGSAWSAMGSGMSNGAVYALAVSGSDVYAGGFFTNAGGIIANHVAKWNGSTWSALGSGMADHPCWQDSQVNALAVSGGDVYAGGFFNAGGVGADSIARWNGAAWSRLGSGLGPAAWCPVVSALAVSGTDLYVGGAYFESAGGSAATNIARWSRSR